MGKIFDIQHFCVDDGPGIRTTVFFKGCPLRCIWCHNPEGLEHSIQLSYSEKQCVLCGTCVKACPNACHEILQQTDKEIPKHQLDWSKCTACGACVENCPESLKLTGREVSVEEVLEDVLQDNIFYENSSGGITLSGGEPLMQPQFAIALLKCAKEAGLHTCVETSGYCTESTIKEAAVYTDLFLFDIKETDNVLHQKFTGVDNVRILSNLQVLFSLGKNVILRCPIIPGCNDRQEHLQGIVRLANESPCVQEIHIEPYHPLGVDKYANFGKKALYGNKDFLEKEKAKIYWDFIGVRTGVPVKIS